MAKTENEIKKATPMADAFSGRGEKREAIRTGQPVKKDSAKEEPTKAPTKTKSKVGSEPIGKTADDK